MPVRFTSFMMGSVVVDVTLTSAARLSRAVSKSWLLQASTWARATATAGESGWVGMGSSPLTQWLVFGSADLDGGRPTRLGGRRAPSFRPRGRLYVTPRGARSGRRWEAGPVTTDLLGRARAGDGEAFGQLVDPYRRELQVHCYRILGSAADAEDALQETLLSAWQGLAGFEGRASIRTWLYRVATSRCIDALRSGRRRPVPVTAPPDGLRPPEPTRLGEVLWLEPYPDDLLT